MELWTQLKPQDPPFAHMPYVAGSQADMEHDAAYAHALVRAMADGDEASGRDLSWWLKHRAESYMREWGLDEKVTP